MTPDNTPATPTFPDGAVGVQVYLGCLPFMTSALLTLAELGRPLRILEVGSWIGSSALVWAEAISRYVPAGGEILCVDPWVPFFDESGGSGVGGIFTLMNETAREDGAYELFRHNTAWAEETFGVRIAHRRGASAEILPRLEAGSFDMVYIDGSHLYEDVKIDLMEGGRLVAEGGLLCGDDLERQRHEVPDEQELLDHRHDEAVMRPDGVNYHPGVTLAVEEVLGEVSNYEGFFVMKRRGDSFVPLALTNIRTFAPAFLGEKEKAEYKAYVGRLK